MRQPELNPMLEKCDSKYALVVLAAKRARQITEAGLKSEDDDKPTKPVTIAFQEISEGLLQFRS